MLHGCHSICSPRSANKNQSNSSILSEIQRTDVILISFPFFLSEEIAEFGKPEGYGLKNVRSIKRP
jgi:hypothetical protein